MAFWNRRKTEQRVLTRDNVPAVMLSSIPDSVSPNQALGVADIFACVRLLASTAATLPLHAYRRVGESGRERITGGRLATLLAQPAPTVTQAGFIAQLMTHLALHGNGFIGLYREQGEISFLGLLSPDRVAIEVKGGRPFYRYSHPQGEQIMLSVEDVCHVRSLVSMDGLHGLSPIGQAKAAIAVAGQLGESANQMLANGSRPSGILKLNRFGDVQDQVDTLRDAFEDRHSGAKNVGKLVALQGDVDYEPIGLPPKDAEFVAQRRLSTVEICRLYGIPPHLVGAAVEGASLTYRNPEIQAAEFLKFGLQPWLTQIEQSLSSHPALSTERQFCEFNVEGLLRADSSSRAEFYKVANDPIVGWLRRDEIRERENLPPEPDQGPSVERMVATARNGQEVAS